MSQISAEDSNVRQYFALADLFKDPSALTTGGQLSLANIRQYLVNPRGTSLDLKTGDLYILDLTATGTMIVKIKPDASGSFNAPTVLRIPLIGKAAVPDGLSFNSVTGQFRIWSKSQPIVYNATATGAIVSATLPWELPVSPWGGGTPAPAAPTTGQTPISQLKLIQNTPTFRNGIAAPDPSGIVYINHNNSLLISDAEVEEMPTLYVGKNLYGTSLAGKLEYALSTTNQASVLTGTTPGIAGYSNEPAGISYNPATRALYISDDDNDTIFQVKPGADGLYNTLDDSVTALFNARSFGALSPDADPEDLAYDPVTGNIFIIDGFSSEVFEVTTEGRVVSQFDTARLGMVDPEAITFLDNGNLAIIGGDTTLVGHDNRNRVGEVTRTGKLVQWFDISAANPQKPAAITFAPSSNDPTQRSLYIVDRGLDNNEFANENDGRLYEFSLGRGGINQAPVIDAGPTERIVLSNTWLDGSLYDDGLSGGAITTRWSQVSGPSAVTFGQPTVLDTAVSFATPGSYVLQLAASDGLLTATRQIAVQALNPQTTSFVSAATAGTVGGIAYDDEDILAYDQSSNKWYMYFDGSDVGLTKHNVKDFHVNADGSILFALNNTATIVGVGTVEAQDIVKFIPSATGITTGGTFELYFDGSDVGLSTTNEKLNAVAIAPDGRIIVSTAGSFSVPRSGTTSLSGDGKDLIAFSPTSLGANTAGTWSMYFDGSDVLLDNATEAVDAVWIDNAGKLYLSTQGNYDLSSAANGSLTGTGTNIVGFTASSLGANTVGTYAASFDPASLGFGALVDGFSRVA